MVWRPQARDQPEARKVKLCHDGARKVPGNNAIIKVPNDEAKKVSTAMSSIKRDCLADKRSLTELMLPWHLAWACDPPNGVKKRETNA